MPYKLIDTADAFRSVVTLGKTEESHFLEFKSEYRWQKGKHTPQDGANQAAELARDVAQFANTDGGALLVGVGERDGPDNQKIADTIESVDDVDGFKQWIEKAIRNWLTPATFSHSVHVIDIDGNGVVAINVPPSLHLIALWPKDEEKKNGIEYLYRTDHGKEWMNPDEVERHIMNGSRAARLAVIDAIGGEPSREAEIAGGLWIRIAQNVLNPVTQRWRPDGVWIEAEERSFSLRISTGNSVQVQTLPYGAVREAWVGADRRVNLLLSVRIVNQDGTVTVEPW